MCLNPKTAAIAWFTVYRHIASSPWLLIRARCNSNSRLSRSMATGIWCLITRLYCAKQLNVTQYIFKSRLLRLSHHNVITLLM